MLQPIWAAPPQVQMHEAARWMVPCLTQIRARRGVQLTLVEAQLLRYSRARLQPRYEKRCVQIRVRALCRILLTAMRTAKSSMPPQPPMATEMAQIQAARRRLPLPQRQRKHLEPAHLKYSW